MNFKLCVFLFHFPAVYYFTPMIFLGCMSICTAVFVARLHHQDGSRPVPRWLRRLIQSNSTSSVSPDDASAAKSNLEEKTRGGEVGFTSKVVPFDDQTFCQNSSIDCAEEWQKCAFQIDRISLRLASFITLVAVLITIIMLAVE